MQFFDKESEEFVKTNEFIIEKKIPKHITLQYLCQ